MNFIVVQGNIAAQSADALMNATGTDLRMGSSVADALRRGGDLEPSEAAMTKEPIDLGAVAVTDTFDLDAKVVIHTAATPHSEDGQATTASVRDAVPAPILCEGDIHERGGIDRLLGDACDVIGMARPFYVEPEPPARLLDCDVLADTRVICENCNNCTVPQATGASGVCRTPAVLAYAGALKMEGAYNTDAETADTDEADPEG